MRRLADHHCLQLLAEPRHRHANGDVAALRTFRVTDSGFPRFAFIDIVRSELYVSDSDTDRILVYDRTSDGVVTALRTIAGAQSGMSRPFGVYLDEADRELYVADADADGDVAPLRTIAGASTLLRDPQSLVVTSDGELVVATSQDGLLVFPDDADGDVAPLRRSRFVDGSGIDSTIASNGLAGFAVFVDGVFSDGFEASESE